MISFEHALPLLIFLVVSFLAFYFVETIILFILNFLIRRYWKFVVDSLLHTIVRHRVLMRALALVSIAAVIFLLFRFTALADLLVGGSQALRLLALILLLTMIVIYRIGSRSLTKVVIEKRIHLYVFTLLSLLAFTGIMTAAQGGYAIYEKTINKAFVDPIVGNIEQQYEKRVEDRLLEIFAEQVKAGQCEDLLAENGSAGVTNLIFIKEDPSLTEKEPVPAAEGVPAGKVCVHETKFLLTPEGKWYEMIEQSIAE